MTFRLRATFYIWLDLSGLEEPINNGLVFFEELLKVRGVPRCPMAMCDDSLAIQEKAICVPGIFFDINPAKRVSRVIFGFQRILMSIWHAARLVPLSMSSLRSTVLWPPSGSAGEGNGRDRAGAGQA